MISKLQVIEFEKHHAFILVFLLIAGFFVVNVAAFSTAYSSVSANSLSAIDAKNIASPVVITREVPVIAAPPEEKLTRLVGLDTKLTEIVSKYNVPTAIVVEDLTTGEQIGINQNTQFVSASLYKLFVGYEAARQIDLGILNPNDTVGFDAGDQTVAECLYRTLNYSDNPCGRGLRKMFEAGDTPLTSLSDAGFTGTSLLKSYPTTNAADVAKFFSTIYDGVVFTNRTNALLLDPLLDQQVDNRIPQGIPPDTKVAHKTGDLEGFSHDSGIVYSPGGDYSITILSGPWPNGYSDAPAMQIELSKAVYTWFQNAAL